MGVGLCLQVHDLQSCPHHSPFPALGAGFPRTLPSAPWDPWLHGALLYAWGQWTLLNIFSCQVIHQEVSVSLEPSAHTHPEVSLGEGHTPRMNAQNRQPRGSGTKSRAQAALGQLIQPESRPPSGLPLPQWGHVPFDFPEQSIRSWVERWRQ